MKILAISGSLRKASTNTALLRAAGALSPSGVEIVLYQNLGDFPLFNPDLENLEHRAVIDFRKQLRAADGVIIASPEYAHGVTGVIKNALDWIVGTGEFVNKPVAVLNASGRAKHAYESLKEILKTMDARLIPDACKIIPLPHTSVVYEDIMSHPELPQLIAEVMATFVCSINPGMCKPCLQYVES